MLLQIFTFILTVVYSFLVLLSLLWRILKNPFKAFQTKDRSVRPQCLDNKLWNHERISLKNISLHAVTAGKKGNPLMLCVHGFPEFWYSWRFQLNEFSKSYYVVAIDNRGYGESDKPTDVDAYDMQKLSSDIEDIIPALGYKNCILVAHDWGGAIAWHVTIHHPELVEKLIMMNCPHPGVFVKHISSSIEQFFKSWYMFFFQMPFLPELYMRIFDMQFLEMFTQNKGSNPTGLLVGTMTDEDIEAWKYTYQNPGSFTPPVNYYRCMFKTLGQRIPSSSNKDQKIQQKIDSVPVLLVWGDKDMALSTKMAEDCGKFVNNFKLVFVPGASHWVQQDCPDLVNEHMWKFLTNDNDN